MATVLAVIYVHNTPASIFKLNIKEEKIILTMVVSVLLEILNSLKY